ncbi:uncharacterized protein Bfra_008937 [Botrytis fragariae]|uniref:Uncharacterized protein n=1 Tax=Botrytis fragariae TaxID=1964551 RepID=A0A8H6AQT6_9HELO|nr:uncharacterized protein Bfra_008937 [Botrytis fragariae]KAF5871911.1 hypothetical protein Bfra_008937 [Botrytis fragariae]
MTDTPEVTEFPNHIFDLVGELMEVKGRIAQLAGREREAQQIRDHGSRELLELAERVQANTSRLLRLQREIERKRAILRGCAVVASVFVSVLLVRVCEIL